MQQLANLNKRIRSVREIRQMTRAMHLISAVKMRKAKAQLAHAFPFFALCAETLDRLRSNSDVDSPFLTLRKKPFGSEWKMAFFVFSGDQGMAGSYILNLLNFTEKSIGEQVLKRTREGYRAQARIYLLGSVGRERLQNHGYEVDSDFHHVVTDPTYVQAMDLSDVLHDMYLNEEADEIFLLYTRMRSALNMVPISSRVLPVGDRLKEIFEEDVQVYHFSPLPTDRAVSKMEFTPGPTEVLKYLIDTYLHGMVYGALTEAFASEQTARMTAMDAATDNAEDMIERLSILSNQARQARITNELSEIVGGAAALAEYEQTPNHRREDEKGIEFEGKGEEECNKVR